ASTKTTCFSECLIRKVQVQGLAFLKIKAFTFVNNCFQKGRNAEIGLFGQALFSEKIPLISCCENVGMERWVGRE
ncbi:MAG: hypothetical protein PF489_04715, partial [Salinivirgaceae bacterium]|nr:hypothetical protein [Salinivirgaceae bacterium]